MTAAALVEQLYRQFQPHAQWSEPRGFTWSPEGFPQRVWADIHGRVHIETDLLDGVPDTAHTRSHLASLAHLATFSAYLWDPATERLWLHASFSSAFESVAAEISWLQALEVRYWAEGFSLPDPEPDLPEKDAPPRPWPLATVEGEDMTFPGTLRLACRVHRILGRGMLLRLEVPTYGSATLANELNLMEATGSLQLGSWCHDQTLGLHCTAFVPSHLVEPRLLIEVLHYFCARTNWARQVLRPHTTVN